MHELDVFVSPEPSTGLWDLMPPAIHRRLPSRRGRRRHDGSETEPTLDAVRPVMEVLYARSDVAHTGPSSVVVDCGICHTLFASGQTDLTVHGWTQLTILCASSGTPALHHSPVVQEQRRCNSCNGGRVIFVCSSYQAPAFCGWFASAQRPCGTQQSDQTRQ